MLASKKSQAFSLYMPPPWEGLTPLPSCAILEDGAAQVLVVVKCQ